MREALDVADRMHDPEDFGPVGFKVAWPEFRRRVFDDAEPDEVPKPAVPTAKEITRMYQAFDWLAYLDRPDARLVRMRLQPKRYRFNPDDTGNSFEMLSQYFRHRFEVRGKHGRRQRHDAAWLADRFKRNLGIMAREINRLEKIA